MKIRKDSLGTVLALSALWACTTIATAEWLTLDERMVQFSTNLNLTADQKLKIKPVLEESVKRFHQLPNPRTEEQRKERHKQLEAILIDEMTKLKGILNAEQLVKYKKLPLSHPSNATGRP